MGTDNCQIKMLNTLWATVRNGKVELLEAAELPEGTKVLVTVLPIDDDDRVLASGQSAVP
jgi:hypothetical protein